MDKQWLAQAKAKLEEEIKRGGTIPYERLQAIGMIDENGEVTGHVRRWDAAYAIAEVQRNKDTGEIEVCRGFNPIFGIPGREITELSREAIVNKLQAGKKIITAWFDTRLELWREGPDVQLAADGTLTAPNGAGDELQKLPEYGPATACQ